MNPLARLLRWQALPWRWQVARCSCLRTCGTGQPSDRPITVDNVAANSKLAELAKAQHPRILATYGGEYPIPSSNGWWLLSAASPWCRPIRR
jgi:hypothetical protein